MERKKVPESDDVDVRLRSGISLHNVAAYIFRLSNVFLSSSPLFLSPFALPPLFFLPSPPSSTPFYRLLKMPVIAANPSVDPVANRLPHGLVRTHDT